MQKQSVNKLLEHVMVKEIRSKICCFLKKNTRIDVQPEIEKLYHAFVSSSSDNEKCAILSLIPNSCSKTEIMRYSTVQGIFLIKPKMLFTFNR